MNLSYSDDQPPAPKLNSTLLKGLRACPGQTHHFECVVEVSYSLVWMSDEYLGYLLEIPIRGRKNILKRSTEKSNTVAILKDTTTQNHTLQLISSLTVQVSESIAALQNHTVTCLNPATGKKSSLVFSMAGNSNVFMHINGHNKLDTHMCHQIHQTLRPIM